MNIGEDAKRGTVPSAGDRERARYVGTVVYIYAFDVAHELAKIEVPRLLGQPVAEFYMDAGKRTPRQLFFYRPQMVRLPPMERIGPLGPVRVERTVKLLPVGAVSVTVRVPFAVERIQDLVVFHDLEFSNGSLHQEVRELAQQLQEELAPYSVRPVRQLADDEAYTVFCISSPLCNRGGREVTSEEWLDQHRREVAALLTQEPRIDQLSRQEAYESTDRYLSYYRRDLVVIDWDAALIADDPRNLEETLHVMELANLQLTELEAYDRVLDDAMDRAYRDLTLSGWRNRSWVLRELRGIRVDLARFTDELSNITKFFGDWHLARIYENVSARFHLADWRRVMDEKLKALDDLYQLLHHDQNNRWMLILEAAIVLLFIIDLVLLFVGLGK